MFKKKRKRKINNRKRQRELNNRAIKLKKSNKARLPQKLRAAELLYLLWQCSLVRFHPGLLVVVSVDELPQAPQPALLCQTKNTISYNQYATLVVDVAQPSW